jgi:hypothetical protein
LSEADPWNIDAITAIVEGFFMAGLEFEEIKSWISACEEQYDERCKSFVQKGTTSLRAIDCGHRNVIVVPPDCLFVALSYVWGPAPASR